MRIIEKNKMVSKYSEAWRKFKLIASLTIATYASLGCEKENLEKKVQENLKPAQPPIPRVVNQPSQPYQAPKKIEPEKPAVKTVEEIVNYKTTNFSTDSDEVLLARMIFGEARGCSDKEKIAVAYTALNRVEKKSWYGKDLKGVILKPWQYSCFNENDPNREKLKDPETQEPVAWKRCLEIAKGVLNKEYADPTRGATHYFNPRYADPYWKNSPNMTQIGQIGNSKHLFLREEY